MRYIIVALALAFIPVPAFAHTLSRDGSVGAVLHITPNDDPVAGEPAIIGFSISDSSKKFSANHCDCTLEIINGTKSLRTIPLSSSLKATYIFPDTGLYQLKLRGISDNNSFTPFTIDQSIRIATKETATSLPPIFKVISALVLSSLLAAIYITTIRLYKRYGNTT